MNKIDYIRGEAVEYEWGKDEKTFTIIPLTNGELIDLLEDFQSEWDEAKDVEMAEQDFVNVIQEKPAYFINRMVKEEFLKEDFLNGYPNDIYNLIKVFKEVNFTFLRSLVAKKNQVFGAINQLIQNANNQQNNKEN